MSNGRSFKPATQKKIYALEQSATRMRVWDISPRRLCRAHLLGEHREIHAIWSIIVNGKRGYSSHPETARWRGSLRALYIRHGRVAEEMSRRGYRHLSLLDRARATGKAVPPAKLQGVREQARRLRGKGCACRV